MTAAPYGKEKGVRFGTTASLVGVLTEAASPVSSDRPAVLFLNSGILHRVGTCRLHVRLARALSASGFHCLRFDFSGIGDSDQRRDSLSFEESAVVETREAMDYLAKTKGSKRFILMGLCSGADMAHDTAAADTRVTGLVLLDAWAYKTLGYKLRRYGPKLLDLGAWRNSLRLRWRHFRGTYVDRRTSVEKAEGVEYDVPKYVRVFPPRERVANDIQGFVARGIQMYYLWTGGLEEYNHSGQHRATFRDVRFGSLLREEHLPDATHILTGLSHQEYVVRNVVQWAEQFNEAERQVAPERV
ncbi:alpha/beta fold hydrolase [Luteitalea sp.]|uniref:alpha/beta fold hydrolase n=1 Tax=Luteitalea sp. TaxID=2004800 RepID=UPI0025BC24AC|nr:alpha/beta fold hydrolase [Luteitalea sp.]